MILALVLKRYEGELICDFAEYYHILDYRGLSPLLVATLLVGLRDYSRVKMKISGTKITLEQSLLARLVDNTSWLVWANSKDGQKNRNKPESVLAMLLTEEKQKECVGFNNAEDFKKAWAQLTGDKKNGSD